MTMSEYEERFQSPSPSLHQTLAATYGPDRARRRSRRFWVAAALVGAITMTCKAALDHIVHNETDNGWQIRKSGIR
jgi:hypothetical protein